jgi:hypothetical protein
MNKDNKNAEVDNTDKKLHISDVIVSLYSDFQVLPGYGECIKTLHFSPENTKEQIIKKLEDMNFL